MTEDYETGKPGEDDAKALGVSQISPQKKVPEHKADDE
mgnify:CR=1 FL=1